MKNITTCQASIAVIDQAAIVGAQGYGLLEAGDTNPVTAQTRFQAASISKPVTALAVLNLVQDGTLELDAHVNRYLRSWQVPENEHTRERMVTLRGLLSHTAGLTVHGFPGYAAGELVPSLRQILDGEPPANMQPVRVETAPGSQWSYSGGGYTVMQMLVEDMTGQPFPAWMRSTVLEPLQMEHSSFEQPLPAQYAGEAATADHGDGRPIDGKWHTYPEMAAAGLWTTPSDLARFIMEISSSHAGKSNRVLSRESTHAERLFTIEVAVLDHGIPVLAACLREVEHLGVDRAALDRLGLVLGPWLATLKDLARRRGPGQKIAYVTDVAFTPDNVERIVALARDADLLVCETPFLHEDADEAARRFHLTARQAGEIARAAGARRLAPFHVSPRCSGREREVLAEASAAFGGPVLELPTAQE